jgi:hypothetical protein
MELLRREQVRHEMKAVVQSDTHSRLFFIRTLKLTLLTRQVGIAVQLYNRIREVRGSNLSPDICYPDDCFLGFPKALQANMRIIIP